MYNIKKIEKELKRYGYDRVFQWLDDPCYDLPDYLSDFQKVAEMSGATNIRQVLFFMEILNKLERLEHR
ncbi:hypothetical protein FHQ18_09370 [Deferribacter autotrophicus]|uniref:Uncharacterized protein n=1 Tax=Deferribacter autotrophicus TaxID=500465 RepID=A0A5A8F1H6_9BACT|nr:hypothetical protein [Deferribacter autotrophicus]KAA0257542.1 hypothetical protein FHQ18_09370 [Deferribacter autotrophicus]